MAWCEEKVEKLKTLWAEGVTAAEIAKELGDVSRNAVIGKAHRLGLSNRSAAKGADVKSEEPRPVEGSPSKKKEAASNTAKDAAEPSRQKSAVETKSNAGAEALKRAAKPASEEAATTEKNPATEKQDAAALLEALGEAFDPEADEEVEVANPVAALAAEAERTSRRLTLLELSERTCKWPIGDPSTGDFYFCGHPCAPDKPYCAAHVQLAYQPMSSRRDRERSRARAASA